jgi:copper oxidase (laccase) domain-containing protein
MTADFGTNPIDVEAAIGPSIGKCCYEVGSEVARQFESSFPERCDLNRSTRIDLAEANRRQLLVAGVRPERIFVSGLCTRCTPREFHSFRRGSDAAGRLISLIGLREEPRHTKGARENPLAPSV